MPHEFSTYKKLCTEFYDLEFEYRQSKVKTAGEAVAFFMNYASQAEGLILEPMCGTGRFLIPMLEAGLSIEGFDASPYMLDALRKKYAKISTAEPPIWEQRIEDFSSEKQYKLIFIPFGSLGLVTDQDMVKKSIRAIYNQLAPGGKLIVEVDLIASAPEVCGVWNRIVQKRSDGSFLALNVLPSYDSKTQIYHAICRYEEINDNVVVATEEEDFYQYLYDKDEMLDLLESVGLTTLAIYQNYQWEPLRDTIAPIAIYEMCKVEL